MFMLALSACVMVCTWSSSGQTQQTIFFVFTNYFQQFLLELVVLGAACLGQKPLSQFLQIARVVHFDLRLLAKEVLKVLEELHTELALLVQTFELLYQLSPDLCQR